MNSREICVVVSVAPSGAPTFDPSPHAGEVGFAVGRARGGAVRFGAVECVGTPGSLNEPCVRQRAWVARG